MKKVISMLLVFVMTLASTAGMQCFASNEVATFDLEKASIDATLDRAETEIVCAKDLDSETKEKLVEKLKAVKKKAKSNGHVSSVLWDKTKDILVDAGFFGVGTAAGLFAGASIYSGQSVSKFAARLDAIITSSSTLSAGKRWINKKILENDFYFGIKEDLVKLVGYLSFLF